MICQKIKDEKSSSNILNLENLKSKLTTLTQCTYAKYWNGHTKFQWSQTNIVCFDLRELFENINKKIINLQMMLILHAMYKQSGGLSETIKTYIFKSKPR